MISGCFNGTALMFFLCFPSKSLSVNTALVRLFGTAVSISLYSGDHSQVFEKKTKLTKYNSLLPYFSFWETRPFCHYSKTFFLLASFLLGWSLPSMQQQGSSPASKQPGRACSMEQAADCAMSCVWTSGCAIKRVS